MQFRSREEDEVEKVGKVKNYFKQKKADALCKGKKEKLKKRK